MHRQLDAGALGHRNDLGKEVLERLPELRLADLALRRRPGELHLFVLVAADERPASGGNRGCGTQPVHVGHPLVTPRLDAEPAHVLEQLDHLGDLVVASVLSALGPVEWWPRLQHVQREPRLLVLLASAGKAVPMPMASHRHANVSWP